MAFARDAFLGKSIVVSGASSGIGRAACLLLADCGARVFLMGRSEQRLNESLGQLTGSGHAIRVVDFAEFDQVAEAIVEIAKETGPLSGIFHSAGVGLVRPAKMARQQNIADVMAASIGGALAIARAASQRNVMAEGGASLVFMSSVAAERGQAGMSVYSASKGAINAAVRSLACELAARAIRVNSIVAGAVTSEMHERTVAMMPAESVTDYERKHLLGFGRPVDIAQVAAFLLSDSSRWVTGASWVVDGGYLAK